MQFIDLKTQTNRIESRIFARFKEVLNHGAFIMGPEIDELERELAKFVNVDHALAVSSGTDALLIALMALDVGHGDEVITTPFSFFATAEVISLLGAKPVFVDIDKDTYNIDANLIEAAITPTCTIIDRVKPILNLKDGGESMTWKERKEKDKSDKSRDLNRKEMRKMKGR